MRFSFVVVCDVFGDGLVFLTLVLFLVDEATFANFTIVVLVLFTLGHFFYFLGDLLVNKVLFIVNISPNRPVVNKYGHLLISLFSL
jgi:hypothetical protein